MADKEKKPLYKSLTVQSSVLLAALIIARAFFPEQFSDELFSTLLGIFGLGAGIGLRRALPLVVALVIPFSAIHCGPSVCHHASIVISEHPNLPKPAGTITVKCDGKDKAVIVTKEVLK